MPELLFNGQFKELKNNGFLFTSLFADKRLCWSKRGFSVFKKGTLINIEHLNGHEAAAYDILKPLFDQNDFKIESLIDQSIPRTRKAFGAPNRVLFYINNETQTITMDNTEYKQQEKSNGQEFHKSENDGTEPNYDLNLTPRSVLIDDIQTLFDFHKKGVISIG